MRKFIGSAFVAVAIVLAAGSMPFALAQTKGDTIKEKIAQAKEKRAEKASTSLTVEVYKDAGGDFRFRIKDGDTLLASSGKGYDSKDEVMKVVNALKSNMATAKIVDDSGDAPKAKDKDKKKGKDK